MRRCDTNKTSTKSSSHPRTGELGIIINPIHERIMPLAVCLGVLKDDGIFSSTPAVGAFRANPMWDVRWMTKIAAALPYLKDMQWTVDMVATDHWWRRDIPMTSTEPEFCGVLRSLDVSRLQSLDIDLPGVRGPAV